ncbi:hypothetical protein K402DRAFT_200654 [Aulographum hederae CBS 113979]|uniref:Uncharacterized protein n=1 Tax=Aulographum hederae CBS 113979 TaxID=1176131 RepID=A0A6G1HC51_9PEZI|nr:hypothetical protein K402DRAFT_200654 [Aulographum hederae CBS 113979]
MLVVPIEYLECISRRLLLPYPGRYGLSGTYILIFPPRISPPPHSASSNLDPYPRFPVQSHLVHYPSASPFHSRDIPNLPSSEPSRPEPRVLNPIQSHPIPSNPHPQPTQIIPLRSAAVFLNLGRFPPMTPLGTLSATSLLLDDWGNAPNAPCIKLPGISPDSIPSPFLVPHVELTPDPTSASAGIEEGFGWLDRGRVGRRSASDSCFRLHPHTHDMAIARPGCVRHTVESTLIF